MDFKSGKLDNGLTVLTIPMPHLKSATVMLWVKTGSRAETPENLGISHFFEHMVFKGSKGRPSTKAIAEAIDEIGGEFNAGTSKEFTEYYIRARNESMDTVFDVLSDLVLNPILPPAEIEKEKGVIIEEIGMHEDTPIYHIGDVFENLIFKGTSLGTDTLGTRESIKATTKEHFLEYRKGRYVAGNALLVVAGGVEHDKVLDFSEEYLSGFPKGEVIPVSEYTFKQTRPEVELASQKREQAHFILGFRGFARGHKRKYQEGILTTILGGPMSSRLFLEIREKRGLAYAVSAGNEHYMDTGYLDIYAGVDPKRGEEAVKVVLDQCYGLASGRYPITARELKKAKEFIKGHLSLALESTKGVAASFGERMLFLKEIESIETIFAKVDAVSEDDVVNLAREVFTPSKLNLAIIGPYNDKDGFEKAIA